MHFLWQARLPPVLNIILAGNFPRGISWMNPAFVRPMPKAVMTTIIWKMKIYQAARPFPMPENVHVKNSQKPVRPPSQISLTNPIRPLPILITASIRPKP